MASVPQVLFGSPSTAATMQLGSFQDPLQTLIDQQFAHLRQAKPFHIGNSSAFTVKFAKTDYTFGSKGQLSLKQLIQTLLLQSSQKRLLLDLGTGTGSTPLALMREFGEKLTAYGLDVSEPLELPAELQIAGNIERLGKIDQLKNLCSSPFWKASISSSSEKRGKS